MSKLNEQKPVLTSVLIIFSLAADAQMTFQAEIFENRREKVLDLIGENSIAVFPGLIRNEFGQTDEVLAKYFYYLTGFEDPGAWLILNPAIKEKYQLFVRPFNPGQLVWTGEMPGILYSSRNATFATTWILNPAVISNLQRLSYFKRSSPSRAEVPFGVFKSAFWNKIVASLIFPIR